MDEPEVHYLIEGGVGDAEAAAIGAAITQVLADEANAAAVPRRPPSQSAWVLAWRPAVVHTPMVSQEFDRRPQWEPPDHGAKNA